MFRCYSYTIISERIDLCLLNLQLLKQSIKIYRCVVNTVVVWLHIYIYIYKTQINALPDNGVTVNTETCRSLFLFRTVLLYILTSVTLVSTN